MWVALVGVTGHASPLQEEIAGMCFAGINRPLVPQISLFSFYIG